MGWPRASYSQAAAGVRIEAVSAGLAMPRADLDGGPCCGTLGSSVSTGLFGFCAGWRWGLTVNRFVCHGKPGDVGSLETAAISYTRFAPMRRKIFDEIEVGETYETPGITVTEWHVMNFAAVSMDFFELHTNDEYARRTQFGGRVAHGLLGLAMADGLKHRSAFQVEAIASLHWSWDLLAPILIGDTIRARLRVSDMKASQSKPDRGVVTVEYEVLNQRDEVVQAGKNRMMVKRC